MEKCEFCEDLKWWANASVPEGSDYRIFVQYCRLIFTKGIKRVPENNRGSYTSRCFRMKYCPCCGTKLTKEHGEI